MSVKGFLMKTSLRKKRMRLASRRVRFVNLEGQYSWCDNQCSEEGPLQIAPMATEEGSEARTVNLCKLCYNAKIGAAGQIAAELERMERDCVKKSSSWQVKDNFRK